MTHLPTRRAELVALREAAWADWTRAVAKVDAPGMTEARTRAVAAGNALRDLDYAAAGEGATSC